MAYTLDPAKLVTDAITSLVNSAVIIGMPATNAPVPLFCLCEIPEERVHGSVMLPGALTQAGEMKTRAVINPSEFEFSAVMAEHDSKNSDTFKTVQTALTAIAALINSVATYGAVLPNLSAIATGYVASQISSLTQIKNNMMPVMILSSYFSLGVMQQGTAYLTSAWYIEDFYATHQGGKDGTVINIKLREQFTPRNLSTLAGAAATVAGEITSSIGGTALGSLF